MNKLYSEIMLISTAGFEMREIEGNIRILTTYISLCRYNPVGIRKKFSNSSVIIPRHSKK